jgi:nucleotide-binding universal stress UspA family protein
MPESRTSGSKTGYEWSLSDSPILLPLAFEAREMNAARVAFFLAEYSGSNVIITHVKTPGEDSAKKTRMMEAIGRLADKLRVKFELDEIIVESEPSLGDIAQLLVKNAERRQCQLIVMSAHREAFFTELFGRVSDRVVRISRTPVILTETPRDGMIIPDSPRRMLIPVLYDKFIPGPFIIASALTSTASAPDIEIIVAGIVEIPPTLPLEAVTTSSEMKDVERSFSLMVSTAIKSLGKLFSPRMLPVRDIGFDVAEYSKDEGIDIIIIYTSGRSGYGKLLKKAEYEIVKKAPCICLVMFPASGQGA